MDDRTHTRVPGEVALCHPRASKSLSEPEVGREIIFATNASGCPAGPGGRQFRGTNHDSCLASG